MQIQATFLAEMLIQLSANKITIRIEHPYFSKAQVYVSYKKERITINPKSKLCSLWHIYLNFFCNTKNPKIVYKWYIYPFLGFY